MVANQSRLGSLEVKRRGKMAGLIRRIVAPVVERLGTIFGTFLVAQGIPNSTAEQAAMAAAVLAGVLVDVLTTKVVKATK